MGYLWQLMPAVLPVLSIKHVKSGIGFNVLHVPYMRFSATSEMPAALNGEVTMRF